MKVTILLADAAQVSEGKLHLLGGNWRLTNGRSQSAVVLLLDAHWNEGNRELQVFVELVDVDGNVFIATFAEGPVPQQYHFQCNLIKLAELPSGSNLSETYVLNIPPLMALKPRHCYEWRCSIDGIFMASRSFITQPALPTSNLSDP